MEKPAVMVIAFALGESVSIRRETDARFTYSAPAPVCSDSACEVNCTNPRNDVKC